jgi:hypothetical protein
LGSNGKITRVAQRSRCESFGSSDFICASVVKNKENLAATATAGAGLSLRMLSNPLLLLQYHTFPDFTRH